MRTPNLFPRVSARLAGGAGDWPAVAEPWAATLGICLALGPPNAGCCWVYRPGLGVWGCHGRPDRLLEEERLCETEEDGEIPWWMLELALMECTCW